MDPEYLSQLITQLYSATNAKQVEVILEEIAEIGDPVFLYPIFEIYKSDKFHYMDYFFLHALSKCRSNKKVEVIKEIFSNKEYSSEGFVDTVSILRQVSCFEKPIITKVKKALRTFVEEASTHSYDLSVILNYLGAANELPDIEKDLSDIYSSDSFDEDSRKYALEKWIESNPSVNLQSLINNYDSIKSDPVLEKILAKIIVNWHGEITGKLQTHMYENGGFIAKNILKKYFIDKETEKRNDLHKSQDAIKEMFSNADLVDKLVELRRSINTKCTLNQFQVIIFNQDESLLKQTKVASTYTDLMAISSFLRDSIQNISHEELKNHGLSLEQMMELLPTTKSDDLTKPINTLELFLHSKGIDLKSEFCDLRRLNFLIGLICAHPKITGAMGRVAGELGLKSYIINEEWGNLHRALLESYLKFLSALDASLKQ